MNKRQIIVLVLSILTIISQSSVQTTSIQMEHTNNVKNTAKITGPVSLVSSFDLKIS